MQRLEYGKFQFDGWWYFPIPVLEGLLTAIVENGFSIGLISTKTPLSLDDVFRLKKLLAHYAGEP